MGFSLSGLSLSAGTAPELGANDGVRHGGGLRPGGSGHPGSKSFFAGNKTAREKKSSATDNAESGLPLALHTATHAKASQRHEPRAGVSHFSALWVSAVEVTSKESSNAADDSSSATASEDGAQSEQPAVPTASKTHSPGALSLNGKATAASAAELLAAGSQASRRTSTQGKHPGAFPLWRNAGLLRQLSSATAGNATPQAAAALDAIKAALNAQTAQATADLGKTNTNGATLAEQAVDDSGVAQSQAAASAQTSIENSAAPAPSPAMPESTPPEPAADKAPGPDELTAAARADAAQDCSLLNGTQASGTKNQRIADDEKSTESARPAPKNDIVSSLAAAAAAAEGSAPKSVVPKNAPAKNAPTTDATAKGNSTDTASTAVAQQFAAAQQSTETHQSAAAHNNASAPPAPLRHANPQLAPNSAFGAINADTATAQPTPPSEIAFEAEIRLPSGQQASDAQPANPQLDGVGRQAVSVPREDVAPHPAVDHNSQLEAEPQAKNADAIRAVGSRKEEGHPDSAGSQSGQDHARGAFEPMLDRGAQPATLLAHSATGMASRPAADGAISFKPAHMPTAAQLDSVAPPTPPDAGQTARSVTLRIDSEDSGAANVVFTDRGGQVQVTVRSSNPALTHALRSDLGSLAGGLQQHGLDVKLWNAPANPARSTDTRAHSADLSGQDDSGNQPHQQRHSPGDADPRNRRRGEWTEEFD